MELGLEGQTVTQVSADFTVSLVTDANYEVRIETVFSMRTPDGDLNFPLGNDAIDPVPVRLLLHQTVTSSAAEGSGALALAFSGGTTLRVEPHEMFEAWTITGPGGRKIVCMAGGELAVWSEAGN
jgi:hypothetical protein